MSEMETLNMNKEVAPWVRSAAFNYYWQYSFLGKSSFYAMISAPYYDFMNRWVKNWFWWYDGWVPYFHDSDQGIPSTKIGAAIVDKLARKVAGGRIMFKNAGADGHATTLCPALAYISGEWAVSTNFGEVVKKAIKYAAAGGTSLLKLNKDNAGLWAEALRFDSFLPVMGARGEVLEIKCFIEPFTNLGVQRKDGTQQAENFYVVEHRYFGEYMRPNGERIAHAPLVEYTIQKQNGSITNGMYLRQGKSGKVLFQNLPADVRKAIASSYPDIRFNQPTLLPFADSLGCELVKWTEGIDGIPNLPFGESALQSMIPYLMSWDYYNAAANTDMYLGRGRVLAPQAVTKVTGGNYNSGFSDFLYTKYESANPDDQKPIPLQFELRAEEWQKIRDTLIENIAINTGVNISTIASFLTDNTARTAREISTEENDTAAFVDEKRALIEKPVNRILALVTGYHGDKDKVVVRWSGAGLTNRHTLTELISMAKSGGFLSQYKAVQMFNFDDDDEQVQEEYERIKAETSENAFGGAEYDSMNYGGGEM